MFRENVLVNDQIIERIASSMIPIALDIQTAFDAESKQARLLQPMIRPGRPRGLSNERDQGIWILSPTGEVLAGPGVGFGDMIGETNDIIDQALHAFGPVERRTVRAKETHPYRGRGVMSDGSVTLAEVVRNRDAGSAVTAPVISGVVFTREEFETLAPRQPVVGTRWDVPEAVAKRFCRITSSFAYQHAPQPDWVTGVQISAEVRMVKDGVAWLDYAGTISSTDRRLRWENSSHVELTGEGVYDIAAKQMRSVIIVGAGVHRTEEFPDAPVEFDTLIEWTLESPATAQAPRTPEPTASH